MWVCALAVFFKLMEKELKEIYQREIENIKTGDDEAKAVPRPEAALSAPGPGTTRATPTSPVTLA